MDPLDGDLLNGPELRSGKIYWPLEPLSWIPRIGRWIMPLLPRDSHAWMNLDAPERGPAFPYAIAAAVKRTRYEYELTVSRLPDGLLALSDMGQPAVHVLPVVLRRPRRYNAIMDTKEKLENALKDAIRAGDDVRKRSIRMVLAAVRQVEIDRQLKLDEAAVLSIIQKEIKTRRESVEEARRANRPDIVASTEAEMVVLQAYLPQALGAG